MQTPFQVDFEALLGAHLTAHQQSLEVAFFQFAKLCGKHGLEASLQGLHPTSASDQGPDQGKCACTLKRQATADNSLQSQSCQSITTHSVDEKPSPRISQRTDKTMYSFSDYIGSIKELPANVKKDTAFKNLAFLDEDGHIQEEVSRTERVMESIFGPKYHKLGRCFHNAIKGWRPMGDNIFANIVRSSTFRYAAAFVIMLNFFFIIIESDWTASNANKTQPESFAILGNVFTAYYTLELFALMAVNGKHFFHGPEAGWNLFDGILVAMGLLDVSITLSGGHFVNTGFLKMMRFLRISRVLRMFSAMRLFKDIRLMVDSLIGSFTICLCVLGMFSMLLAMFAIVFVQGLAAYLANPDTNADLNDLQTQLGCVSDVMFALFMSVTGGTDWEVYYYMLKPLGWKYEALFLFFIAYYVFAFFNVVIGVFCQKALSLGAPTTEELMADRYAKEFADARELYGLLGLVLNHDQDTHGNLDMRMLDMQKFEFFISHPVVEQYFEARGLKPHSAHRFFHLLCELHGSDHIDFSTFVSACVKLDGPASSIDLHVMSVRQLHGLHQMQKLCHDQHRETKKISRAVDSTIRNSRSSHSDLSGPQSNRSADRFDVLQEQILTAAQNDQLPLDSSNWPSRWQL